MEKLQGPINPCEELGMGCLEDENGALDMSMSFGQFLGNFEDPYSTEERGDPHCSLPSLEDKMPFLQMLHDVESHQQQPPPQTPFFPLMQEPNFQLLLRLQHQKLMMMKPFTETDHNQSPISCLASAELESCVTNNDMVMDLHSPAAAQISTLAVDKFSPKGSCRAKRTQLGKLSAGLPNEKRKRKRLMTKPSKNKEEVESQRMTHIAVERNRRRQMNDHLNALRSLMPPSYVQRGDQASIIGGAIDFVKELEQLLQSLEAQKRMRQSEENGGVSASSTTSSSSNLFGNLFMAPSSSSPLQYQYFHSHEEGNGNSSIDNGKLNEELSAENRSALADIQVMVIQNHVNLKIRCQRRPGQLLNAIVALERLRFSVLHLNITSLHSFVFYSFNLKIEEDCKLGSADEVASAVRQIFSLINSG